MDISVPADPVPAEPVPTESVIDFERVVCRSLSHHYSQLRLQHWHFRGVSRCEQGGLPGLLPCRSRVWGHFSLGDGWREDDLLEEEGEGEGEGEGDDRSGEDSVPSIILVKIGKT